MKARQEANYPAMSFKELQAGVLHKRSSAMPPVLGSGERHIPSFDAGDFCPPSICLEKHVQLWGWFSHGRTTARRPSGVALQPVALSEGRGGRRG